MTTTTKHGATTAVAGKRQDATTLLRADHKRVSQLFAEYEKARSTSKKKQLANLLCSELTVHTQLEEEIFYPAVKQALKDKELISEAMVEHVTLRALIGRIEGSDPGDDMYDANIKVLDEYVKHHVKEEHNEMFPQAKASDLDMLMLGDRITERKAELLAARRERVPMRQHTVNHTVNAGGRQ